MFTSSSFKAFLPQKYWQLFLATSSGSVTLLDWNEKETLIWYGHQYCGCVLFLSYSRIFLLLQPLPLQAFLLFLLLLSLLAVGVEGRSVHVVAGDAKSSAKTVVLLLVGCGQSMSLCHPERKHTKQLCFTNTVQYVAIRCTECLMCDIWYCLCCFDNDNSCFLNQKHYKHIFKQAGTVHCEGLMRDDICQYESTTF